MAMLSTVERRLCQQDEAESISEALSRAIRHMTLTTLISATPKVANVLTAEVVLNVLVALAVALMVLLTVLIIDESIYLYLTLFGFGSVSYINTRYQLNVICNVEYLWITLEEGRTIAKKELLPQDALGHLCLSSSLALSNDAGGYITEIFG